MIFLTKSFDQAVLAGALFEKTYKNAKKPLDPGTRREPKNAGSGGRFFVPNRVQIRTSQIALVRPQHQPDEVGGADERHHDAGRDAVGVDEMLAEGAGRQQQRAADQEGNGQVEAASRTDEPF